MGWPSAIAPPLTLTFSLSHSSNLTNGQRLHGKGLVGFDEIHLVQRPAGALQRLAAGAHRADAHHGRVDAGDRRADNSRQHRQAQAARALSTLINRTAAAPSLSDEALPGGDAAVSRAKRRAQLRQLLLAGLRARLLVVSPRMRGGFLPCGTLTGTISALKAPGGDSSRRFALGAGGEGVLAARG